MDGNPLIVYAPTLDVSRLISLVRVTCLRLEVAPHLPLSTKPCLDSKLSHRLTTRAHPPCPTTIISALPYHTGTRTNIPAVVPSSSSRAGAARNTLLERERFSSSSRWASSGKLRQCTKFSTRVKHCQGFNTSSCATKRFQLSLHHEKSNAKKLSSTLDNVTNVLEGKSSSLIPTKPPL